MNGHRRGGTFLAVPGLVVLLGILLAPSAASAYHDQGYPCYQCHSLKPSDIRIGSNAIRWDQPVLSPVATPSGPTAWTGGMPITCDFCHRATDDVPIANFASKAVHHPVRTIPDNGTLTNEIACGDCHNADVNGNGTKDLAPATMTTKTTTDGYPDHDNVTAGYAHDLTSNLPHLTLPYWSSLSLPGATRANDTAFWTGVRLGTQDMVCWVCHEGAGRTNAPTRAPLTNAVSTRLVRQDYVGSGRARGHQIRTNAGGSQLGVGAALPCYDCHDSHGSVNSGLILDNQSIYGSSASQVAVTTFTGANDLVVCAQCHDTGNAQTATTKAGGVGKQVEGLYPVDPYNSAVYSAMHVDSGTADNMLLSTRTCLANNGGCHANPHNPLGESAGGLNCGVCHGNILAAMDNGSNTGYHHVIMADNAPIGGLYPINPTPTSAATDRTCTVCHVDHTLFSPQVMPSYSRGRNLRRDITQQPDNITNTPLSTDYDNTLARGGICTSCHENRQTKRNPGTDIKADGSTYTPMVSKALFGASAHNYPTASPYLESKFRSDNTLFQSNCAKCHNDTSAKRFQDNTTFQFSLHASDGANAVNKLLAPLGYSPLTDNLTENFCYRCHSHATDLIGGTRKGTDGRDWYNKQVMSAASENTWASFQRASRHPVSAADQAGGTRVVDCLNCHNVHLVGRPSDNTAVSNPDNTYASVAGWNVDGTGPAAQSAFCLSCHDGTPPAYQLSTNVYVPADVRVSSAGMNKTAYAARAHWTDNQGQIFNNAGVACTTCHDKHGGSFGKLLDNTVGYHDVPVTPSGLCLVCHGFSAALPASGNNNTYCFRCHTQDQGESPNGYPPTEADRSAADNGYFSLAPTSARFSVRWPGRLAYEGSFSPHGSSTKTFPGFDNVSRIVSSCNTCHDVHGTANRFNELKDTFRAGNYALCFRCHGRTPTATDNISRYYPAASGGDNADSAASTNVGHNIKTSGGYLSPTTGLPCYDCHGIHGSATGNTQLKSDQRWSGVGNTKYGTTPSDNAADIGSRAFCLGCHTAIDNAVAGTVENLNRQAGRLKLPAANPIAEHFQASSQGCHRCHYGYTYNDNSFGPHYPGTGVCDTCHESQGVRSAAAATYNGAHRTHTDNTLYKFACKQCHSWTATASAAVHKNDDNTAAQHAEVRFDNQAVSGWSLIQYATVTQYEYRSLNANPFGATSSPSYTRAGVDNTTPDGRRGSVRWTNGTCGQVWCHSNANPIGGLGAANVYQSPAWLDNSLRTDCTGCHGGDRTAAYLIGDNGAVLNGSVAHKKHVGGNIGCSKCHSGTVQTSDNRLLSVLDNHVNGIKNVKFSSDVGGTWDNGNKTCAATYCHGTPSLLPKWDNLATVTGCGACHVNQGAGAPAAYMGPHHPHSFNAKLRIACEACHAGKAAAHDNAMHAGGPDNAATGKTAEVLFSDNAANHVYDNLVFLSKNMWLNPYDNNAAMNPAYAGGASYVGSDTVNPSLHWTQGACTNVWCHSNAKPLGWKGVPGQNVVRAPSWDSSGCTVCHNPRPNDINCTPCHRGRASAVAMAGTDNLSGGHITHVATDRYNFTCDECHAWTVPNDSSGTGGLGIIFGTGHDNHVDGVKTVRFGTTLRTTTIDESGGTYDNGVFRCYNTYCHSNGTDTATFDTPAQWPRDNTIAWNSATGTTCATCHNYTAASGFPMTTQAHDNHVNNASLLGGNYSCYRCHAATVNASDNVNSYANHVNGFKNVAFSENAAWATYNNGDKQCSNTFCHRQGNRSLGGAQDNLSIAWDNLVATNCRTCHGSRTGAGYTQFGASLLGEPNYDNAAFGGGQLTANSHARHVVSTDNTAKCSKCHPDVSPTVVNALASDNYAMHINDNVEVRGGNGASFAWTAASHQCSNISCHGGGTARWGQQLNCNQCHESQGAGTGPAWYTGPHRTHADNTTYKVACEQCHAARAVSRPIVTHGSGKDNAASARWAEVKFTDNGILGVWSYGGASWTYDTVDLWTQRYGLAGGITPAYYDTAVTAGTDNVGTQITWSAGTCASVWCHSNANPASAGGGANAYRTPGWGNPVTCTSCHLGRDTQGNMQAAPDRLSFGHAYHVATDFYYVSCDECHANTVPNDCTAAILSPGGYAFHVNGNKRDIRGSTSVRQSSVVNNAFVYDNNHDCTNNYCHSNGRSQAPPFSRGLRNPSFRFIWDNALSPGCTGGNVCHPSSNSFADQTFTADGDNSAHTKHHYTCSGCHTTTIPDPYGTFGSGLHVNGVKDVTMIGVYDNDLIPNNNYDNPTKTCSAIPCHGGKSVAWTDNNLTCASCHTTTNGDNVSTNRYEFVFSTVGAPNLSKVSPGLYRTRGHGATDNLPWTGGTNPYALFGRAIACLDCHDMAAPHTADNNAGNFFRFRATINGRPVALDNADTVCYACHDSATVRDHATAVTGGGASAWQHTQKCVDCHDVHGQSNIFMIYDNIVYQDNTAAGYATSRAIGVPYYPASRSAVAFTNNANGSDYASTDNLAPFNGICEVCHERTAQYQRTGTMTGPRGHSTAVCTTCHKHDSGFKGMGGQDIEQYFDGSYNAASATSGQENYDDRSRHPLTNGTTPASLLFGGTENCLGCHGAKYKSGGATHYANECLKCHFENVSGANPGLDGTRHMNRAIELSTISGNGLPGSQYAIGTLAQYDGWCLQCHGGTTVTLNGIAPSAAQGTYIDNAAFANGRHRAATVGCIYCHQPHGRSNAMAVRENPQNRRSAGETPAAFGVYPTDNTGGYGSPANQNLPFRARQYWSNGTLPHLPEAADDQGFCNMACHIAQLDARFAKDKMILRDNTLDTGNYVLSPANRKIYVVNGMQYTLDNITSLRPYSHQHPNGDVITTDNMVQYYAGLNNISGPSYYKYPLAADAHPSSYNPATSDLPLTPDYVDGSRDFTNAYSGLGVRLVYRTTCSACHNPHGNNLPNASGGDGYPDLRLRRNNPNTLCLRCHK